MWVHEIPLAVFTLSFAGLVCGTAIFKSLSRESAGEEHATASGDPDSVLPDPVVLGLKKELREKERALKALATELAQVKAALDTSPGET